MGKVKPINQYRLTPGFGGLALCHIKQQSAALHAAGAASKKKAPQYINKFYRGNQASFARLTGVQPAQVTQWINKGFIVVNHTLYSPRRKLGI
ncbi:hypothetical protein KXM28_004374 [Salmonella enterica]|nr:hypothetical protein [Salmonella enterica]